MRKLPPHPAKLKPLAITIGWDVLDPLIGACRRRDRVEAAEALVRWREAQPFDVDDFAGDVDPWEMPDWDACHDLTSWVRDEAYRHIDGGRFEHALCLLERYRFQPLTESPFKELSL